ncbi:MAG: dTDP-4-dehydrorhamnose 3,5-epimerase [Rhodothermia bacterium]|nr:MAG: dTDP-4-dehydrorhamnose 3,5-epimerase [Rhodothermia bacterium]
MELMVFEDERGSFHEIWQRRRYADLGIDAEFVQDNRSVTRRKVLRGLHYQIEHPQGHLVTVSHGRVLDVGVDLRPNSPTFGRWTANELSDSQPRQIYLPPGIAHGFCVLSERAELLYKCTDFYYPEDEGGLLWSDPDVAVRWPLTDPIVSDRDNAFLPLKDIPASRLPKAPFGQTT